MKILITPLEESDNQNFAGVTDQCWLSPDGSCYPCLRYGLLFFSKDVSHW